MIDTEITMNHVILLIAILYAVVFLMIGWKLYSIVYGDGKLQRENAILKEKVKRLEQKKKLKRRSDKGLIDEDIVVDELGDE